MTKVIFLLFAAVAVRKYFNEIELKKMMAELLLSKESIPEDMVKLIKMIESAAANSLLILNDTLNISKIESGTISLNKAPYDYVAFIKEAILTETYLSDKKSNLQFSKQFGSVNYEF